MSAGASLKSQSRRWHLFRRFVAKIRRELAGLRSLNAAERAFALANRSFWMRHLVDTGTPPDGYVLVEPQFHPLMLLSNANMAAAVATERDLAPLFLLANPLARSMRAAMHSYPRSAFAYVFDFRGDFARLIRAFLQARAVYATIRSPDDILGLAIDGIRYGDLVYDTVLQQGYATVDRVDFRTLRELWRFFFYRLKILHLTSRYRIAAGAFTGKHSVVSGTLFRYLVSGNIEVVLRSGPRVFAATKYRSLADAKRYELRPEQRYVRQMVRAADVTVPAAEEFLRRRLAHEIDPTSSPLAFDNRKRTFVSRVEFCEHYGLDPARPLVFVMLHMFNDQPHLLEPILFRDYYLWFERTLEVATTVDSVTWVFKEHPASDLYTTKDFDFTSLQGRFGSRSLLFLDANADFNSRSLPHLAHAIVTCVGTAGLEYSAFGVPCLLGGNSPYSGFGFTIEPESAEQYVEALRRIDRWPRLTAEQATMAKLITFFELHVLLEPVDPFFRYYDWREIPNVSYGLAWRDAAAILSQSDQAALDEHVRVVREFLRRPDYAQYVDFERFPFLKGALDEAPIPRPDAQGPEGARDAQSSG